MRIGLINVLAALCASTIILTLSGCASSSNTRLTGEEGYLFRNDTTANFLQWTRAGSRVTGTLTHTYIDPSTNMISSGSDHVSGTIGGNSVTFTSMSPDVGYTGAVSGEFSGSTLTLTYPDGSGKLITQRYQKSTVSAFNADAAVLQARAAKWYRASAQATATYVASTCAVFTRSATIVAVVQGAGHWPVCRSIKRLSRHAHVTDTSGDFNIGMYVQDCTGSYRDDTLTIYDNEGDTKVISAACRSVRQHRLPLIM